MIRSTDQPKGSNPLGFILMWVKMYKDSWFPVYDIAPSNAKNHDAVAIINYQRYLRWKRGFRRFKKLQAEIKAAIAASNQPPPGD